MEETFGGKPRLSWWQMGLIVLFLVAVLLFVAWFCAFRVNRFSLAVQLAGEETVVLEYGTAYEEPGAQVILSGTLIWKEGIPVEEAQVQIQGQVEEENLGKQCLTYTASYHGLQAEAQRTVCIIDTVCPVISLVEEAWAPGEAYREAGYTATDNHDGDISDRVVITRELGRITYAVVDSSGNPAVVQREVADYDPVPPQITLEGGEDYIQQLGKVYEEPGYTAVDNVDGELTEVVAVSGEVDWIHPGVYQVEYAVEDAYGNPAKAVRSVHVEAKPRPETVYPEEKTIYLTFDDGPGAYTMELLEILDKYDVKATFFVVDTGCDWLMKEIVDRGHSIGIHTVSHNYEKIYASPEAFFDDIYAMQEIIYENTGVWTTLMRFPGGSSNTVSCRISEGIMSTLSEAVQDAGFQYFDWNVSSGDAGDTKKTQEVVGYVKDGVSRVDLAMVLQHDIHDYSVAAVEEIIQWGLENGYQFLPVTESTYGFHHNVEN